MQCGVRPVAVEGDIGVEEGVAFYYRMRGKGLAGGREGGRLSEEGLTLSPQFSDLLHPIITPVSYQHSAHSPLLVRSTQREQETHQ